MNASTSSSHILIVSNNVWTIIKFRQATIRSLLSARYRVSIAATVDKQKYVDEARDLGVNFYEVKINRKSQNPIMDFYTTFQFFRLYRSIKPDLILHYTIKPNIYGSVAARMVGIPCISMITGVGYAFSSGHWVTKKLITWMYKAVLDIPKVVWFANDSDRQYFISNGLVKESKTDIMPGSGVNINLFKPNDLENDNHAFIFLMIARLQVPKGVQEYIDAARIIKLNRPYIRFQILGYLDEVNPGSINKKEIEKYVNEGIVEYLGSDENVRPYISNAQCVVLPSYREGTPRTLLEAAAMGRPIITTNAVGCKEVVDDNVNGYLCHLKDATDLAGKMEKVVTMTSEEREMMGLRGRKKVESEFDERIVIEKYIEIINYQISLMSNCEQVS